MNSLQKLSVAVVVLFASTFSFADTIQLGSYANGAASMGDANTAMNFAGFSATSTTASTGTGTSYMLPTNATWDSALSNSTWVGASSTAGPVGTVNLAEGYYTFTTTFTALPGESYGGSMSLMADDTAEVLLNGVVLVPFSPLGSDAHCADTGVSCLVPDTVTLWGLNLASTNTLTFIVQQAGQYNLAGDDPTGVDFATVLTGTPEPESWLLMLTGLGSISGSLLLRRMKRKTT
jgi:hypothetical protein